MTEARSKRRVLPLVFIVKSFTKSLLISDFQLEKHYTRPQTQADIFICLLDHVNTISGSKNVNKLRTRH